MSFCSFYGDGVVFLETLSTGRLHDMNVKPFCPIATPKWSNFQEVGTACTEERPQDAACDHAAHSGMGLRGGRGTGMRPLDTTAVPWTPFRSRILGGPSWLRNAG